MTYTIEAALELLLSLGMYYMKEKVANLQFKYYLIKTEGVDVA